MFNSTTLGPRALKWHDAEEPVSATSNWLRAMVGPTEVQDALLLTFVQLAATRQFSLEQVKTIVSSCFAELEPGLLVMLTNYVSTTCFYDRPLNKRLLSPSRRFMDQAARVHDKLLNSTDNRLDESVVIVPNLWKN